MAFLLLPLLSSFVLTPSDIILTTHPQLDSNSSSHSLHDLSPVELHSSEMASAFSRTEINNVTTPNGSPLLSGFGNLLVLYGDYVNESGQEPVEVWITLFHNLGFNSTSCHLDDFSHTMNFDLLVVTPSIATSNSSFGLTPAKAQEVVNCSQPILLLGYGHEVLDQLHGFDPISDFVSSIERYLWPPDETLQIFALPYSIPFSSGRYGFYETHIHYDAYRVSALPAKAEVLGTNYDGFGAQLLWYRAYTGNPYIYYWGIDQAANLNSNGKRFCENLLHWLIRPTLYQRLGQTLGRWQLPPVTGEDYWAIQGAGGFGYPLEPSLRFSYYVVDLVETHGLSVNLSQFGSWLHNRYNVTLGCFEDLASNQYQDRCITTALGVLMADDLGILDQFNQTRISQYLANCQDYLSGGFFTEPDSTNTSITATRFAIESLAVLGQLQLIDDQAAIGFIADCQELDSLDSEFGGFYSSASGGFSASLVYATDALLALEQLMALNAINQSALLDFIAICEDPAGSVIFDTKRTMDSDEWVLGTSCVIQLLKILSVQHLYDLSASRAYILSNQFPNGGWGRGNFLHDFHNSPDETWQGAQALALTGGLGSTEPLLTQYLHQCCTEWGGATEPFVFGDFLTSVDIIMALWQIDALNMMNITAFLEFLENCWSPSRSSYVAHQLSPTVGTDTDSPTPDRIASETGIFGPLYHYGFSQLISCLGLSGDPWATRAILVRQEIEACQTNAIGYSGMLGLHHLYVGHESDVTFRFDTTCWNLLAHQNLGGQPADFDNSSAILAYLLSCLQSNSSHQYFQDHSHSIPLPDSWRIATANLAETWLGLQAYAYLKPTLSDLDGDKLATYAINCLQENSSIITTYYVTELLHLLIETGLKPDALSLLDWTNIKQTLLNAFTFEGLIVDSSFPQGKWMPHLINLGLQQIQRLQLLPRLDINPVLKLTELTYPTGVQLLGTNFTISAMLIETRWMHIPPAINIQTQVFNKTFLDSCNSLGYFELQDIIPISASSLGPQNLSLIAFTPGFIPDYAQFQNTCTGWGTLTLNTTLEPGSTVPRSVPLNVTMQLELEGTINPNDPLMPGTVSVTVTSTSQTYSATSQGMNQYGTTIPTQDIAPTSHELRINATIPFCTFYTELVLISIILYETYFTLEDTIPSVPTLFEPTTLTIGLWNTSGTPLASYPVIFNITQPGESIPQYTLNEITNENGFALCSWTPNAVGQWQITYSFTGQAMYNSSQSSTLLYVNRRPLACVITLLPSSTLFVGNQNLVLIEVSDALNGTLLSGHQIHLYEDEILLDAATSDSNGQATCTWLVSAPVGTRELHIEISGTATYDSWVSSHLMYLIRDTTTLTVSTDTPLLYVGETLTLNFSIVASASALPNGTVSVYWDGSWQQDVPVFQGFGHTTLTIPITELAGEHLIVILFGHLDTPDMYTQQSASFLVTLRGVITPTLTVTVNPLEIDDPLVQPVIEITLHLIYQNNSISYGLSVNLTMLIHAQDGTLVASYIVHTDSTGSGLKTFPTPQPGLYSVTVQFEGQRGFAHCMTTTPFLVRHPFNRIGTLSLPFLLGSIAVMIIGLIVSVLVVMRLQKRLNEFVRRIQPTQSRVADLSNSLLDTIDSPVTESQSDDTVDMDVD